MEETKKEIEELKKLLKLTDDDIKQIVKLANCKCDYDLCCELIQIAVMSNNIKLSEVENG
jgi:hypothetical protein